MCIFAAKSKYKYMDKKDKSKDPRDPDVKLALGMCLDATVRLNLGEFSILTIPEKVLHNDNLLEELYDAIVNIEDVKKIYISEYCFGLLWMFLHKGWTYGSPSHQCAIKAQETNWPAKYKMILIVKN